MAPTAHHGSYGTICHAHEAVFRGREATGYQIAVPERRIDLDDTPPIRRDDLT